MVSLVAVVARWGPLKATRESCHDQCASTRYRDQVTHIDLFELWRFLDPSPL